jgi:hypothetical protein
MEELRKARKKNDKEIERKTGRTKEIEEHQIKQPNCETKKKKSKKKQR